MLFWGIIFGLPRPLTAPRNDELIVFQYKKSSLRPRAKRSGKQSRARINIMNFMQIYTRDGFHRKGEGW